MPQNKEQRRHLRLVHRANIQLITRPPEKSEKLLTRDMSESGLFLTCKIETQLKVGDIVEVQVLDIENALAQKARVVRIEPDVGIAVEYVSYCNNNPDNS